MTNIFIKDVTLLERTVYIIILVALLVIMKLLITGERKILHVNKNLILNIDKVNMVF